MQVTRETIFSRTLIHTRACMHACMHAHECRYLSSYYKACNASESRSEGREEQPPWVRAPLRLQFGAAKSAVPPLSELGQRHVIIHTSQEASSLAV